MNRIIDYQSLCTQNFQLKNEITDLKNAFDLNKDVLKILQQSMKETHPRYQIYVQIISRFTKINNQIMFTNIELIQDKSKLMAENKKLTNNVANLTKRFQELVQAKDCTNLKQIHIEMREQIKELRAELLVLSEECLRKNVQISKLEEIVKIKEKDELKKPIIPSIQKVERKISSESFSIQVPKKYETNENLRIAIINKGLQRQNNHLKRLVEELQYRLTLLARLFQEEHPSFLSREKQLNEQQGLKLKRLAEQQLHLLMFALNHTEIKENDKKDGAKLTITTRNQMLMGEGKKLTKCISSIF